MNKIRCVAVGTLSGERRVAFVRDHCTKTYKPSAELFAKVQSVVRDGVGKGTIVLQPEYGADAGYFAHRLHPRYNEQLLRAALADIRAGAYDPSGIAHAALQGTYQKGV